ncbi:MAG: tRNA pseudouridine(55) synthase TruB [Planctomycetota bacterium]
MSGILIINKPAGLTSHDVIDILRQVSGVRRIGHTGTLDPMATGVLVTCLEQATRIIEFIPDDKEYQAVLQLGTTSDTLDRTGKILSHQPVNHISELQIKTEVAELIGSLKQVPPMFSAIKIKGRRLYELARAGQSIPRPARTVEIYDLKITAINLPFVHLKIHCSSGTYIRSLAETVGEKLGCGALLFDLTRTRVGPFGLEQSIQLPQLNSLITLKKLLKPMETGINHLPTITVSPNDAQKIKNGQSLKQNTTRPFPNHYVRIYTNDANLLAIGKVHYSPNNECFLKPVKVLTVINDVSR